MKNHLNHTDLHDVSQLKDGTYSWRTRGDSFRAFVSGPTVQTEYHDGTAWDVMPIQTKQELLIFIHEDTIGKIQFEGKSK